MRVLDTVRIKPCCDGVEMGSRGNEEVLSLPRNELVIPVVDHVHVVAMLALSLGDQQRFPMVGVACGNGLVPLALKRLEGEGQQDVTFFWGGSAVRAQYDAAKREFGPISADC